MTADVTGNITKRRKDMGKRSVIVIIAAVGMMLCAASCAAAQEEAAAPAAVPAVSAMPAQYVSYFNVSLIVTGFALALVAAVCGIAQGMAVGKALDGIARQPEATPKIQLVLMIGLAFIESLVLYTLFIGIILLFVNPFMKYFVK